MILRPAHFMQIFYNCKIQTEMKRSENRCAAWLFWIFCFLFSILKGILPRCLPELARLVTRPRIPVVLCKLGYITDLIIGIQLVQYWIYLLQPALSVLKLNDWAITSWLSLCGTFLLNMDWYNLVTIFFMTFMDQKEQTVRPLYLVTVSWRTIY